MERDYDIVVKQLNADILREDVAMREGGNGKKLAYLEGWLVIDKMNSIVGIGNWSYETLSVNKVYEGTREKKDYGKSITVFETSYIAHMRVTAKIGKNIVTFTDYGYGDGQDKANAGKAHELAVKEAVTDGIKRCAKNLGRHLGLALYDKQQQHVTDEEEAEAPKKEAKKPKESKVTVEVSTTDKYQTASEKELHDLISATSRVVIKKGKATKEELVQTMKTTFGVEAREKLNKDQARQFLINLESLAA